MQYRICEGENLNKMYIKSSTRVNKNVNVLDNNAEYENSTSRGIYLS